MRVAEALLGGREQTGHSSGGGTQGVQHCGHGRCVPGRGSRARQALEFLPSQGTENEGESLIKILHSVSMVYPGWRLVPNLGFRGYFNLDGEVIFLSMIILLTAKYLSSF